MIVEEYSQCKITIPGDKLPALSQAISRSYCKFLSSWLVEITVEGLPNMECPRASCKNPVFGSISIAVLVLDFN
jgi:hypothetical protein